MLLPAAAGVAAGIISSVLFSASQTRAHPAAAAAPVPLAPQREFVPLVVTPPPSQDPIDELRDRMARLEQRPAAPGAPRPSEIPEPSFEELKAATIRQHQDRIQTHKQQTSDPSWGPATGALLRRDLTALAESSSFSVVEADCRTTSCTGTVEWPSYGNALAEWRRLLHHPYEPGCSRAITLPEPADTSAPYQATVVLDCEAARAESH
jgi:hypothetical protein